jgi:hypothetical protein
MRHLRWFAAIAGVPMFPAVALAYKPADPPQAAALYRAFSKAPTAGKTPQRCLRLVVSTADASWATIGYRYGVNGPLRGCLKYEADGVIIFHYRGGRWRYVSEGSDFLTATGRCVLTGKIPRAVLKDLRLCPTSHSSAS